MTFGLDLTTA